MWPKNQKECFYCHKTITIRKDLTKDHWIDKCIGGKLILYCCHSCNQNKSRIHDVYFSFYMAFIRGEHMRLHRMLNYGKEFNCDYYEELARAYRIRSIKQLFEYIKEI